VIPREIIGNDELLSRQVFHPPMFPDGVLLLVRALFEFPGGQCESLVWHRYAAGLDGIHRMGCERQTELRQRQLSAGRNADKTYVGAATARAVDITQYRNPNGHGFSLCHEPAEGIHHVHVCYDSVPGSQPMTRGDKGEIKLKLAEIFHALSRHVCPDEV